MIKLQYVFEGNSGELVLKSLSNYGSKNDVLESIETSDVEYAIIEDSLKTLKPDVDPTPQMYAQSRGGERHFISPKSEAIRLGFSTLIANIDNFEIVICC